MTNKYDAIVIGAGISGLTATIHLQNEGLNTLLIEASDRVGGRVKTDNLNGFKLDRGFQVLLTAYPEAQKILDYKALKLKNFYPGSKIYYAGKTYTMADPRRKLVDSMRTFSVPFINFGDKLKVLALRNRTKRLSVEDVFTQEETSTLEYLSEWNFSKSMMQSFFKPFLGGIFLEDDLTTSSRMFEFVFKMFSSGYASLPEEGIEAIPRQLAAKIKPESILLNTPVKMIDQGRVILEDGRELNTSSILLATDAQTTASLLPQHPIETESNSVRCLYFSAPKAPFKEPALLLNGSGHGWINNIAIPTNLHKKQAPDGRALISITVVKEGMPLDATDLYTSVRRELKDWFGEEVVEEWTHLKTYEILNALPRKKTLTISKDNNIKAIEKGVFLCGDFTQDPSLNGAMRSGRQAANAISWDLALAVNR